jgi:glyoxalase superfamily protein
MEHNRGNGVLATFPANPASSRATRASGTFLSNNELPLVRTMTASAKTWIGTIVIDCEDWEGMTTFWKAALGYGFKRRHDESWGPDWALIATPNGLEPNLAFQKDPLRPRQGLLILL